MPRSVKLASALLSVMVLGCLFCELIMTKDPAYLDLANSRVSPNSEFLLGTDTLGRDIFSGIWYGGRVSVAIGVLATVISTFIGVVYGSVSGLAPMWADTVMMRLTEIFLSIPNLLLVIFVQAIFGRATILSISLVLGITGWASIAKMVRIEVRRLRNSEYIIASRCMGGGFFHILRWHLAPNFFPTIMFMVVMNVRGAIAAESTLSFMGIGLPIETISLGSMLSLSEKALLSGAWWIILVPGIFLVALLMCITEIGNHLRRNTLPKENNL